MRLNLDLSRGSSNGLRLEIRSGSTTVSRVNISVEREGGQRRREGAWNIEAVARSTIRDGINKSATMRVRLRCISTKILVSSDGRKNRAEG